MDRLFCICAFWFVLFKFSLTIQNSWIWIIVFDEVGLIFGLFSFWVGLCWVGSHIYHQMIYYEIITFYDVFCTVQNQNIRSIHKQRILSFKSCCNKFVHFMTARAHLAVLNQYNAIVLMYDSIWLLCDVFFKRFHHTFGDIIHWIYQIRSHLECVVFQREYTKHNAYITYINGSKERFFDY